MRALVDSRSCRCDPTYYSCDWKALSHNSHRMSERCCIFGIAWNSAQNSWLITSVPLLQVKPYLWGMTVSAFIIHRLWDWEQINTPDPSKATGAGCWGHWLLDKRTKSHWETGKGVYQFLWWWTHAFCQGGVCVCLKDTSLVWTIGNACRQGHFL